MSRSSSGRDRGHPSDAVLRAVAAGGGSGQVRRHVESCATCSEELALLRALGGLYAGLEAGEHPGPELLVRRADGAIDDAAVSTALEAHLVACLACAVDLERLQRADAEVGPLPVAPSRLRDAIDATRERLRALVAFETPESFAIATRSGAAATAAAFEAGMSAYRDGRYDDAISRLGAARDDGERAPELRFYLGVALLRRSRAEEAAVELRQAVRRSARLGEYRWFLAQAELSLGNGEEALKQLKKAAALPGPYKGRAKELAAKVKAAL